MKSAGHYILISVSSLALIVVLAIQVQWILQSAKMKEELFNEKANMVVARTAEDLSADPQACQNLESGNNETGLKKTDSLVTSYMNFYNFNTNYTFKVTRPEVSRTGNGDKGEVYSKVLDEAATQNGLELNLYLPGRREFIVSEMGPLFLTSVLLIMVVLILFWRTVFSLLKEKRLAIQTTAFLNNMTHEFKTPMTNIALAGKMILKENGSGSVEKIKNYSEIILTENDKLRFQVEQLLGMNALERGEQLMKKEKLDVHELLERATQQFRLQIEDRNGEVQLNLDAEYSFVRGDDHHLCSAFSNLIDNAIKYSKEAPAIVVETSNEAEYLVIKIKDKGIGIPDVHAKKIFEKFYRVPSGDLHDVKGFGLGLTYVEMIVAIHGGNIDMKSETGAGTTFIIKLKYV
jgi:two-component system phosphate regulon sensor histidine kinase PhoR